MRTPTNAQLPGDNGILLLSQALDMSPDLVCITDLKGSIVFVNKVLLDRLGYVPEELLGQSICSIGVFTDQDCEQLLSTAQSGRTGWRGESAAGKKDGSKFRVSLTMMPVLDGGGKSLGVVFAARNIVHHEEALKEIRSLAMDLEQRVLTRTAEVVTHQDDLSRINRQLGELVRQLEEAKRKAEESNKVKSQFLAHVSHEMRTPLTSVIGFANLLSKNKDARFNDQELFYLNRIIGNSTHLLNVISQMLDLSMIESGKLSLSITEFSVADLVRETISEMRGHARAQSVSLIADIPKGSQPIESDRQKLKQVLINLLGNALKFTESGGITVRMMVDVLRQPSMIEVIDTGIGIPKVKLDSIFEAFERVQSPGGAEYEGTGLGLAISKSLCNLMGFDLSVESEVGKGSTFTVHFQKPSGTADL